MKRLVKSESGVKLWHVPGPNGAPVEAFIVEDAFHVSPETWPFGNRVEAEAKFAERVAVAAAHPYQR